MLKREFLLLASLFFFGSIAASGYSAEKAQFGATKAYPPFYLPILAAEEKGFWKEQGIDVEWAAMRGGAETLKAAAGGAISMGAIGTASLIPAIARGAPVVIVSDLKPKSDFFLYVRADSPYKELKDLKGVKIGVTGLGGTGHVYAQAVIKAAALEKEVRFVGRGGIVEGVAALKAKAVDASVQTSFPMVPLVLAGEVRELAALADYLPKEWAEFVIFARKDVVKDKPEIVRRVLKGMLKGTDFVMTNRSFTVEKMKAIQGASEEAARLMFEQLGLSRTGRVDRKAMENIRNFIIEYEIVPKGTPVPSGDELFTTRFTD